MQRRRHAIAALSLFVLAALVIACKGEFTVLTPASGPLLTVETRGGECFAAPCGRTVMVEPDGRVHETAKPPNDLGVLPPEQLAAIADAIKLTDFAAIRAHPFTGECPTAFDGQEIVYTFAAPGGTERIASCEVDIDEGLPLFVAVATALGPWMPLPVT
jgi:hypothetical protein